MQPRRRGSRGLQVLLYAGAGINDADVLERTMGQSADRFSQDAHRRRRAALLVDVRPARPVGAVRLRRRPQLRLLELRVQRRAAADADRRCGRRRPPPPPPPARTSSRNGGLRERASAPWACRGQLRRATTAPACRAPAPATAGPATRRAGTTCTRPSPSPPTAPTGSPAGSARRPTTPTATSACARTAGQVVGEQRFGRLDGYTQLTVTVNAGVEHVARRVRRAVGERRHLAPARRRRGRWRPEGTRRSRVERTGLGGAEPVERRRRERARRGGRAATPSTCAIGWTSRVDEVRKASGADRRSSSVRSSRSSTSTASSTSSRVMPARQPVASDGRARAVRRPRGTRWCRCPRTARRRCWRGSPRSRRARGPGERDHVLGVGGRLGPGDGAALVAGPGTVTTSVVGGHASPGPAATTSVAATSSAARAERAQGRR